MDAIASHPHLLTSTSQTVAVGNGRALKKIKEQQYIVGKSGWENRLLMQGLGCL